MKILKYFWWCAMVGCVVALYYFTFDHPVGSKKNKELRKIEPGKYISFYNIDNEAKVLVNDSLIFESGIIDDNPDLHLNVELNPFLKKGKNLVKVELKNSDCTTCPATPWGIRYELVYEYEVLDFVEESSIDERDSGGVKFEKTYEIFHQVE